MLRHVATELGVLLAATAQPFPPESRAELVEQLEALIRPTPQLLAIGAGWPTWYAAGTPPV